MRLDREFFDKFIEDTRPTYIFGYNTRLREFEFICEYLSSQPELKNSYMLYNVTLDEYILEIGSEGIYYCEDGFGFRLRSLFSNHYKYLIFVNGPKWPLVSSEDFEDIVNS